VEKIPLGGTSSSFSLSRGELKTIQDHTITLQEQHPPAPALSLASTKTCPRGSAAALPGPGDLILNEIWWLHHDLVPTHTLRRHSLFLAGLDAGVRHPWVNGLVSHVISGLSIFIWRTRSHLGVNELQCKCHGCAQIPWDVGQPSRRAVNRSVTGARGGLGLAKTF